MNSGYNYRYMPKPLEYYDYNYDVGTLAEVPDQNAYYRKQNKLFSRLPAASIDYIDIDASGYGGGGCYEEGVSIGLLLTTFLGIAIMGYTLYQKVKANGGKRKRSILEQFDMTWVSLFPEIVLNGKLIGSFQELGNNKES